MPRNSSVNRGLASTTVPVELAKPSTVRCAIYTRKSTEEGLQQEFNSLDAQREAAEAFIRSQKHEGWEPLPDLYDDGGYTGGNMDRPALQRLIDDINRRAIDCVVVYKVDRLSRSLLDFAKLMELFDKRGVSFVSVTQQFNTTNSLGRLTLNILLSFAQFEREIISERTRDKLSAARRKGKWIGGHPMLGYDIDPKGGRILVNADEAQHVRTMYDLYLKLGTLNAVWEEVGRRDWRSKQWTTEAGVTRGGKPISKSGLYGILTHALYNGMVDHKGILYPGEHERIVEQKVWDRVQEGLRENGRTNGAVVKNRDGALLRGVLFCRHCGTAMRHTYTHKGPRRYRPRLQEASGLARLAAAEARVRRPRRRLHGRLLEQQAPAGGRELSLRHGLVLGHAGARRRGVHLDRRHHSRARHRLRRDAPADRLAPARGHQRDVRGRLGGRQLRVEHHPSDPVQGPVVDVHRPGGERAQLGDAEFDRPHGHHRQRRRLGTPRLGLAGDDRGRAQVDSRSCRPVRGRGHPGVVRVLDGVLQPTRRDAGQVPPLRGRRRLAGQR